MRQFSKPFHVLMKLILPDPVHMPKSLHHHGRSTEKNSLIGGSETPTAQNLSGSFEQVCQLESLSVVLHEVQCTIYFSAPFGLNVGIIR